MDNKLNDTDQLHEEIIQLKKQVQEYESLIKDISAPIIPSIVPETILIPITGRLYAERFEMIIAKILEASYQEEVSNVIIDFTAISKKEIGDIEVFGKYIRNLTSALDMMGIQTLYAGFTPAVTQVLVQSGLNIIQELQTFSTFRTALQYLMREKGLEFKRGLSL
ncbi:STAS domain-containing protein [Metabacillus sp. RGM 3146]|uniref:STAS domain-containing protein n=1 Tax=Metabacillus sp. RGM 3146 TaxID=3401092 RepID=UPI003B9D8208